LFAKLELLDAWLADVLAELELLLAKLDELAE